MDQADARVRRITPNGIVSTYAGTDVSGFKDGDVSVALFRQGMGGIAMGTQGAIYIDDTNNGRIRKISAAGQVSTFAGKETKGFVDGIPLWQNSSIPTPSFLTNKGICM